MATQLTLSDIENSLKIIDLAAERGAFKGSELTSVGTIRDRIAGFLNEAAASAAAAAEAAGETSAEAVVPETASE